MAWSIMRDEARARQDLEAARQLASRGREEMDRADRLAPDALGVMLVRAVTLSASAPNVRDRARGRAMLQSAAEGFERALALQTPYFGSLSAHARGELLAGLAESWWRLGETEKARGYLERIVKELPDTPYQATARAWLAEGRESGRLTCLTCHQP